MTDGKGQLIKMVLGVGEKAAQVGIWIVIDFLS